ncbi:MAG: hypothetical protein IT193_06925 [Propionibacteriaceae bacterium]|nr:hypothetical protein [Propionibacteriaceae bacterium]
MGDISTHAEITEFSVAEAKRFISTTDIPDSDYTFLELGNFLTDVSQFRDPPAFHRARDRARAEAQSQSMFAGMAGADNWVRDVFGRRAGPVNGGLADLMAGLMQAFTQLLFDNDGLPLLGSALGLIGTGTRPALIPAHGIPPAEVSAAISAHYTQYFPHEHLDFPPTHRPLPTHRTDRIFQRQSRGLIGYLEWFTQYLSEDLSKLELEWATARARGITATERKDFLIRLGHLSHPIEDYFFHANLLDLYQWRDVLAANSSLSPSVPAELNTLIDRSLTGTSLAPTSVPLRRILARRLRYPVWTSNTALSTSTSEDASDLVFTGGFGDADVSHTLGGALEAIEGKLAVLPSALDPRRSRLVLIRMLLSASERQAMISAGNLDAVRATHLAQLRAGDYPTEITRWESSGLICTHAAARLRTAFAGDRTISERHSGTFVTFPGPGAILLTMLEQVQRERDASAAAKARLNGRSASIYGQATNNTASAEHIGTHSLMSKDSSRSEPMRPEAVAFAKHAAASIITTMLRRIYSPAPVTEGVDWDSVLRFYLRQVAPSVSGPWENEVLDGVRRGAAQARVDAVHQQPAFSLLGPALDPAKLAARRVGATRAALEAYYRSFETDPP